MHFYLLTVFVLKDLTFLNSMLNVVFMKNYQIKIKYVEYNWDISLSLVGDEVVCITVFKNQKFYFKTAEITELYL